jgi:hypothetical protein
LAGERENSGLRRASLPFARHRGIHLTVDPAAMPSVGVSCAVADEP